MLWIMVRVMWCSLVLVLYYHPHVYGKEGILKEGTMRDWYKSTFQVEGSGQLWDNPERTGFNYSKTSTASDNSDFWLITNYADVKNKTTIIYVEIEYKIDSCRKKILCNLTIYVHKGKDPNIPRRNRKTYLYSNFSLVHVIRGVTGNRTKTRFKLSYSSQYITFGISAKAVDATLYGIKMFYYYCEETFINNIYFPKTTSSANQSKAIYGNCSENSKSLSNGTELEAFCLQNGTWTRRNGSECLCVGGFEPRSECQPCMTDHFKSALSNDRCTKCPEGNRNNGNKTTCTCKDGKYNESPRRGAVTPCFGLPQKVLRLTVENITKSSVILKWKEPLHNEFSETLKYDVECYSCSSSKSADCKEKYERAQYNPGQHNLTTTSVTISNLKHGSKYKFNVYSKNMISKPTNVPWKFASESKSTLEAGTAEVKANLVYIIAGVAAIIVLLILVIVILIFRSRRKSSQSDSDVGYEGLVLPTLGQRPYVDPANYDDPEAAVRDFANEIDAKALSLERVLGGGEFGDVYKGTLTTTSDSRIVVAAKTLKHDSDMKSRKDFFMEASAMGQFDDPNVIRLEGVITKSKPHMIITEYMANGSLNNFLKQNEEQLTDLQMIGMARGVASGMKYLAGINFIHRDLAARNILVNETLVCKVADFGLSRELETDESSMGEYCTSGGKIPVRWTAPEAIKYRKFSTASDVWSYGILLWEIMSFAERPYWDWDNFKVMERVDEGFRLPLPMKCPKAVHELMLKCWEQERNQRPQFADIVVMMDEWIRSPETIRDSKLLYRNSTPSEIVKEPSTPIKEWLDAIKLSAYMPYFTNAGYKELSDLAGLLDHDLKEMGITLIGHRNKMLRTIRSLPITDKITKKNCKREKSLQV